MTKIPRNKPTAVMPLLKATYAQEDKDAMLKKVVDVEQKLRDMGLKSDADLYAKGVMETRIFRMNIGVASGPTTYLNVSTVKSVAEHGSWAASRMENRP